MGGAYVRPALVFAGDEAVDLPEETSLCLRRAALQGQPANAHLASRLGMQLADMGLDAEAERTLRHAMSISPDAETAQSLVQVMQRRGKQADAQRLSEGIQQTLASGPSQSRLPTVIQLSPSQFASISPAVNLNMNRSTSSTDNAAQLGNPQQVGPNAADRSATSATPRDESQSSPQSEPQQPRHSGSSEPSNPKQASRFTPAALAAYRPKFARAVEQTQTTDKPPDERSAMKRFLDKIPTPW